MATADGRQTIQDTIDALVTRIGDTDQQITDILSDIQKLNGDFTNAEKALAKADTALDAADASPDAASAAKTGYQKCLQAFETARRKLDTIQAAISGKDAIYFG